jgi:hypothetical protein
VIYPQFVNHIFFLLILVALIGDDHTSVAQTDEATGENYHSFFIFANDYL